MKKGIGVAAFVALMAAGITSFLDAQPIGGSGFYDGFYSDDTFTTVVGERYLECNSGLANWGVHTRFVEAYQWDCTTGASIGEDCGFWVCDYPTDNPSAFTGCHCVG